MCVSTEREYRAPRIDVDAAASFASAAVLIALTPADWQICEDVKATVGKMAAEVVDAGASAMTVTVVVHAAHVEVSVTSDRGSQGASLGPRRPFTTDVECRATA